MNMVTNVVGAAARHLAADESGAGCATRSMSSGAISSENSSQGSSPKTTTNVTNLCDMAAEKTAVGEDLLYSLQKREGDIANKVDMILQARKEKRRKKYNQWAQEDRREKLHEETKRAAARQALEQHQQHCGIDPGAP